MQIRSDQSNGSSVHTQRRWFPGGGFQPRRYRPGGIGNWSGHLPFAGDLVAAAEPKLLVELGTHYGESYFGFCQAIAENNLECLAYAVDTWLGEPHTGYYQESVFKEVEAYNSANYSAFSHLLKTSFDQALTTFSDDSIDILHIDGLHTYEAVAHDFYSWLPKVRLGGIVLLHDVVARHEDFGVWKLWDELESLGDRFAFTHSWGLGVFRKPGAPLPATGLLPSLFHSDRAEREHLRNFYSLCALKLEYQYSRGNQYAPNTRILIQIYPFLEDGYSEENAYTGDIAPGQWQHLTINLNSGLGTGPLRLDFAERPAVIDLAGVVIRKAINNEILWRAEGAQQLASLNLGGTIARFETPDKTEFTRFISFGSDPQLFLPSLDRDRFDQPLLLDIWVRAHIEISSLLPMLKKVAAGESAQSEELKAQCASLAAQCESLSTHHESLTAQCESLTAQSESLTAERDALLITSRNLETQLNLHETEMTARLSDEERLRSELEESLGELRADHANLEAAHSDLLRTHRELERSHVELSKKQRALEMNYRQTEQTLQGVLASHSWRLTAPLRSLMLHLRSLSRN